MLADRNSSCNSSVYSVMSTYSIFDLFIYIIILVIIIIVVVISIVVISFVIISIVIIIRASTIADRPKITCTGDCSRSDIPIAFYAG